MVFKISDSWDNDSGMSTEYDERKETEHQKLTAGKRNKLSYWSITVELLQSKIFLRSISKKALFNPESAHHSYFALRNLSYF